MSLSLNLKPLLLFASITVAAIAGCGFTEIKTPKALAAPVVIEAYCHASFRPNAQVLFGRETNLLDGWNHVPLYPAEFNALAFPLATYRIDNKLIRKHGNIQYSTTLIKKYADWNHQHSNGITASFPELLFSDVAGIELVVRVNGAKSRLPSRNLINKTYGYLVNPEGLKNLDDGNIYLSLALRTEELGRVDMPKFNAEYLLSLDAKTQRNRWYHIFIPVSALALYSEVSYHKTPLSITEAGIIKVSDFKLTAETRSTKVIRHLIPDIFDHHIPTLFKEIGVDIQYIGVVKRTD